MYLKSSHIFILELAGKSFDTCEGLRLVLIMCLMFTMKTVSHIFPFESDVLNTLVLFQFY